MSTAWAEYYQGFVQHPALIAPLRLTSAFILDLDNDAALAGLGVDRAIDIEPWRDIVDRGGVSHAYFLRERLLRRGVDGIISHPSCRAAAVA
jgi:RES domain-containing protein